MGAIKWKGYYYPCNCCGCGGSSGGGGGTISPGPTPNDGKTEFFYKSDQEPRLGYSTADQPYDNAIVIPGPNDGQLTFKDHEGNELGVFTADQDGDTEITLPQGFSGDYNDLINKPDINDGKFTIKDADGNILGEFTANQLGDSEVTLPAGFSGDYNDLINKPDINDGKLTFKDENGDEIENHSANTPDDNEVTVVSQSYIDNSIHNLSDEVSGEINALRNELCYYDFNFNYKLIQGADPAPGECAVPFEKPEECQMFRLHRTQLDGTQVDTTELHEDDILYFEQNLGDWIQYEVLRIDDLGPDHFQISVNYLGHGDNNTKSDPPKYYWDRPCLIYERTQRPDDYDPCNPGLDCDGVADCLVNVPIDEPKYAFAAPVYLNGFVYTEKPPHPPEQYASRPYLYFEVCDPDDHHMLELGEEGHGYCGGNKTIFRIPGTYIHKHGLETSIVASPPVYVDDRDAIYGFHPDDILVRDLKVFKGEYEKGVTTTEQLWTEGTLKIDNTGKSVGSFKLQPEWSWDPGVEENFFRIEFTCHRGDTYMYVFIVPYCSPPIPGTTGRVNLEIPNITINPMEDN